MRETKWKGDFGSNRSNPLLGYTLLGQGFLRSETAESIDEFVQKWVKEHPSGKVVPVVDYGASPDGTHLFWVWLVDGDSNLNHELVRSGMCAAQTMVAPEELKVLVPADEYADFERQLPRLEKLAKQEHLGVWK